MIRIGGRSDRIDEETDRCRCEDKTDVDNINDDDNYNHNDVIHDNSGNSNSNSNIECCNSGWNSKQRGVEADNDTGSHECCR